MKTEQINKLTNTFEMHAQQTDALSIGLHGM